MADHAPKAAQPLEYSPDDFRMTVGEHLEELRKRLILAIIGFGVALGICLWFGTDVMRIFCQPLVDVLRNHDLPPQLINRDISSPFVVYINISLLCALVLASPWIVWQFWLFVAAGLYPHERKAVTRYVPLSIGLLVVGVLFVYFAVLPMTLEFFLGFGLAIPQADFNTKSPTARVVPAPTTTASTAPTTAPSTQPAAIMFPRFPVLDGDPLNPPEGSYWYNTADRSLRTFVDGSVRTVLLISPSLVTPQVDLAEYIDLVFGMVVLFGLSFQLPLVVMALCKVGIVEQQALKDARKYVYFALAVLAAVITPGDVITASIALMIPLCLLYELGIWLGRSSPEESAT